jgi:hypothetical protein
MVHGVPPSRMRGALDDTYFLVYIPCDRAQPGSQGQENNVHILSPKEYPIEISTELCAWWLNY